jgi:NAD(P)-dependent dehydrogenase (short-subunit alcohol dehydrogenase family)
MTSDLKMPSFRLDGSTALVTGAGRGLGAAIAEAYATCGADIILLGRTRSHLDEVAQRINAAGGQSRVIACDVTDDNQLRNAIADLPTLDILVNNAGTNFPEPFVEVSDEHLDTMIDLNVRACFVAAQAAVKKMGMSAHRIALSTA